MNTFALINNFRVTNIVTLPDPVSPDFLRSLQLKNQFVILYFNSQTVNIGDLYDSKTGAFSTPILDVQTAASQKLSTFQIAVQSYIDNHYTSHQREQFTNLYLAAQAKNLTNRMAYIRQLFTWVNSVISYSVQFALQVNANTDSAQILAMKWDIDGNVSPDPKVKIGAALQILS